MYLSRVAASMWSRKGTCLSLLVLSCALAIWLTHTVSWTSRSLHPRPLTFGVAQVSLLVDTGDSPLADSTTLTYDIDQLAGDFAQLMRSGIVLDPVARALHITPSRISTQAQLVGDVATTQTEAGEAQAGNEILDDGRDYSILARVDQSSFVIQLYTQAPTAAAATRMASIAAGSLSHYISATATAERTPKRDRIILRQIGPATGGEVDASLPTEAAVLLTAVFFVLSTTAFFSVARWRRIWKADRAVLGERAFGQL